MQRFRFQMIMMAKSCASDQRESEFLPHTPFLAHATATATKRSLKKWIRAASNFIALIPSRLIRQMLANFLELNSKGLYQSSGKEKENCCFVFPSSTKREIWYFHVVVVERRLRNVQKGVMHVQSQSKPVGFLPFSLPWQSSLLKFPISPVLRG